MRDTFISIVALLALSTVPVKSSDVGKDGFNFYKDYIRTRNDELISEKEPIDPGIYFYRTPLQLYPGLLPIMEQEYRKRTANIFKNRMLNKELGYEGAQDKRKRSSKTALSLMMLQGKQKPYQIVENLPVE